MPKTPAKKGSDPQKKGILDEHSVAGDPFQQFSSWFRDAVDSGVTEPEAMFLATAGKNGKPSGRIVLLKGVNAGGFVFFTNYNSRKGNEIEQNPFVALTFHWKEIERQVRITGTTRKIAPSESDEYFASRPTDSRISAIISAQSSVVKGRTDLERRFDEMKRSLNGKEPPRPPHWGGIRVIPDTIEFWQSGPNRLHDRIRYRLSEGQWIIERLAP
jgi:pyridoxamine 5'-phosphate oxidase